MLPTGARWFLARSVNAAMTALYRSGVPFRRPWQPPLLAAWEGPWENPEQRLPMHPQVRVERREARARWKARKREREAAKPAAERKAGRLPAAHDGARRVNVGV